MAFGAWWCVPLAAVPLLMLTAHGGAHPKRVRAEVDVPERRLFEGEILTATIRLAADGPAGWTRQEYLPPRTRDDHDFGGAPAPSGVRLESMDLAGSEITVKLLVPRWGRWSLGAVAIDVHDTAGLRLTSLHADLGEVEAFPVPAPDDTTLTPVRFPDRFGEHSARTPGEGVEFIQVRPYVFGDRQRRINWSATSAAPRGAGQHLRGRTRRGGGRDRGRAVRPPAAAGPGQPAPALDPGRRGPRRRRPGPGLPHRARPDRPGHPVRPGPVADAGVGQRAPVPDRADRHGPAQGLHLRDRPA